jgi:hypothetical protein
MTAAAQQVVGMVQDSLASTQANLDLIYELLRLERGRRRQQQMMLAALARMAAKGSTPGVVDRSSPG